MILYQKKLTKDQQHIYNTRSIDEWREDSTEDYCFYYDWLDQIYEISFQDCLEKKHIDFLRKNSKIKVIFNFVSEPPLLRDVDSIIKTSETWNLDDQQIVVIVGNELQKKFVDDRCNEIQNTKIVTYEYNYEMKQLCVGKKHYEIDNKKFSILSRIHRPWRSYMLCRLKEENLLDNFHYSFMGCINDMEDTFERLKKDNLGLSMFVKLNSWKITLITDRIKKDLNDICNLKITNSIEKFIDSCPHYIEKKISVDYHYIFEIPQEIIYSDFHIILESGFFDEKEYHDIERSFLVSEKTWKAIIAKKPFLVFSDSGFLDNLRKLGFKTFDGLIDESYNLENDHKLRAELLIKEIIRINSLNQNDYNLLKIQCQEIADYNFELFCRIKDNMLDFESVDFNKL